MTLTQLDDDRGVFFGVDDARVRELRLASFLDEVDVEFLAHAASERGELARNRVQRRFDIHVRDFSLRGVVDVDAHQCYHARPQEVVLGVIVHEKVFARARELRIERVDKPEVKLRIVEHRRLRARAHHVREMFPLLQRRHGGQPHQENEGELKLSQQPAPAVVAEARHRVRQPRVRIDIYRRHLRRRHSTRPFPHRIHRKRRCALYVIEIRHHSSPFVAARLRLRVARHHARPAIHPTPPQAVPRDPSAQSHPSRLDLGRIPR